MSGVMFPKPEKQEKQRKGLQRKTPLKAKSRLKARPNGGHRYVGLHKRGYCAICGKALGEMTCWHHIQYRSHGGSDDDANLIEVGCGVPWLCRCHELIHAGEISREEVEAAKAKAGSYKEAVS